MTKPLRLRAAIGWYLLCAATIFGLMASGGDCKSGGIVYCYGDARDYWWHPSKVIASLFFGLLLPLPHILIALFSRTKRNFATILGIGKKWHRAAGLLIIGLLVLGFASSQLSSATGQRTNLQSESAGRGEALRTDTGPELSPIALGDREMALSLAIECASLKKKLGNVDDAVKINGYVIYKLTESRIPQESGQKMIFEAVGKVSAFYAEHSQDRARVERMEAKSCSSAKAQLADFPSGL